MAVLADPDAIDPGGARGRVLQPAAHPLSGAERRPAGGTIAARWSPPCAVRSRRRCSALPSDAYIDVAGYFGLATTAARDARAVQKIQHHDGPDPHRPGHRFYYLCRGEHGNTRLLPPQGHRLREHRPGPPQRPMSRSPRANWPSAGVGTSGYAGGDMADYDKIGRPVRVHRLVGASIATTTLHSALLGPGEQDSGDLSSGRLTPTASIEERCGPDAPPAPPFRRP